MHTLRQEVLIRNNSDEPCEIYSLEFDELYKQTDVFLRDFDGFDESGIALLPVRCSLSLISPSIVCPGPVLYSMFRQIGCAYGFIGFAPPHALFLVAVVALAPRGGSGA